MEPYYYSKMNKQQQRIYQCLKKGIESLEDTFDIPRTEGRELSDIFYKIRLDCPELFYVSTYRYTFYENSSTIKIKPVFLFDKSKIMEHQRAMQARIEKLIRPWKDKTETEKERLIHDFICENITYDKLKKQYSHEIIGPLGNGVGVCEGIAKSVKILCDHLKLSCIVVVSENNPEMNIKYRHAWNIICIGGNWYHLDATFDNTLGHGQTRYDYFNLDDRHIFRDHQMLLYPAPICLDGGRFYYKEKKLSFTKFEDIEKRSLQAIRKGTTLTFHWRGSYLTREVLEDVLKRIESIAGSKNRRSLISLNWPQAVIRVNFTEDPMENQVRVENIYEEPESVKLKFF